MYTFIWSLLYHTVTWIFLLLIASALPLLQRIRPKFAKWFRMRFWPQPLDFTPKLWIHAVSIGEINIALALMKRFANTRDILLTTSTQTGYALLAEKMGRTGLRYLPWDLTRCYARLFGGRPVPDLIVVETEIWPRLFSWVTDNGSRVVIINGRLSSRTLRLKRNPLLREALSRVTRINARGVIDFQRFRDFGVSERQLAVTGNMKFDFVPGEPTPGPLLTWLAQPAPLLVMASLSADEAPLLAPTLPILFTRLPSLRVLWAPRHPDTLDKHLAALANAFNQHPPVLRSQLDGAAEEPRLLILDTFGELSGCYGYAKLSLVGGSFNQRGGQNFLESLQAGTPAVLGPSTENFSREVAEATEAEAIVCVANPAQAARIIGDLLADEAALEAMSQRAADFLEKHRGAIARTIKVLVDLNVLSKAILEDP